MPIEVLPAQTISAIGSDAALSDPASLVKELIDNAVDGRATSISVEMSANTLDDVRVKDNGHGVGPEDRRLVCTRYCTSKIKDFEELQSLGGRSLGFRGVALASIAEMSGCLTISTRVEGEETASELKFDRQGQLLSGKPVSHPFGTTVRIERFFQPQPVRKQAMEKASSKTLTKIKKQLQSYALARPYLRLSFKVLKAKNEKDSFKFPLTAHLRKSALDTCDLNAATQVVGKKVVDQCQHLSSIWSIAGQIEDQDWQQAATQDGAYKFEAVLAKAEYDASAISNIGQYISVDSRPVSNGRGSFKQIVTTYKSHLRSLKAHSSDFKITDPFLCLNIVCPTGAYDVNIEPAKDDVLFTDQELVLELTRKFFVSLYGEVTLPIERITATPKMNQPRGIELMLAKKKPPGLVEANVPTSVSRPVYLHSLPTQIPFNGDKITQKPLDSGPTQQSGQSIPQIQHSIAFPERSEIACRDQTCDSDDRVQEPARLATKGLLGSSPVTLFRESSQPPKPVWKGSMYADDEDEEEDDDDMNQSALPSPADVDKIEDEAALKSVHLSNPWAIAKLHAPFRPPGRQATQGTEPPRNNQLPTPLRQIGDAGEEPCSPSPSPFPYPLKARAKRRSAEEDDDDGEAALSNKESYGSGSLDTWVQKSINTDTDPINDKSDNEDLHRGARGPPGPPNAGPFVSARTLQLGTPLSDIPDISQRPQKKALRRQQQNITKSRAPISPTQDLEKVWFDNGETPRRRKPQQNHQKPRYPNASVLNLREDDEDSATSSGPGAPVHPDLAAAMDYENRKQLVNQQHRASLRHQKSALEAASRETLLTASPHKNRQRAAIAALHINASNNLQHAADEIETSDDNVVHDPRFYLTDLQRTSEPIYHNDNRKAKRRKTALLPFETLTSDKYIGDLVQTIPTAMPDLSLQIQKCLPLCGFYDDYIHDGIIVNAFEIGDNDESRVEIAEWESTLKAMVKSQYRIEGMSKEEEMEGELDVDLWSILAERGVQVHDL